VTVYITNITFASLQYCDTAYSSICARMFACDIFLRHLIIILLGLLMTLWILKASISAVNVSNKSGPLQELEIKKEEKIETIVIV